jgi:hypothetical protein
MNTAERIPTEREKLEQQVQQQVTQQQQHENQARMKIENLVAGIYAESCARLIAADNPSFDPERVYRTAFESAIVFAKEMWGVTVKRPGQEQPSDSPES